MWRSFGGLWSQIPHKLSMISSISSSSTFSSSSSTSFRLFSILATAVVLSSPAVAFILQQQQEQQQQQQQRWGWPWRSTTITTINTVLQEQSSSRRKKLSRSTSWLFFSDPLKPNMASCEESSSSSSSLSSNKPMATNKDDQSPTKRRQIDLSSYQPMTMPDRATDHGGHAIFGTLLGDGMIESYKVYRKITTPKPTTDTSSSTLSSTSSTPLDKTKENEQEEDNNTVIAVIQFGNSMNGHPGVVHGGILSLLLDDAFGMGYEALGDVTMAVTANLTVDFRAPVPEGTTVAIIIQLEHREGRKLFWTAQITSMDQTILYAEAKSLYIIPRGVVMINKSSAL